MSDQVEKKLQNVVVARYEYRHEAEFAAGFLDDAGIPYRLQVDDPGLGMSVGVSATIWVRGMDVDRAREVLEVDQRPVSLSGRRPPSSREIEARGQRVARTVSGRPTASRTLDLRERGISFLLSAASVGLASAAAAAGFGTGVVYVAIASAAILALVGLVGRAPGLVRRLLSGLAGNAP